MVLLSIEKARHSLSPGWVIEGSREEPKTIISEERSLYFLREQGDFVLEFSLTLETAPRKPHR